MSSIARPALLFGVFAMAIMSVGCLVNSHTDVQRQGVYVAETTLKQIEPGKTSSSWVLATLGPPTEKTSLESNRELWKYSYKETKDSKGDIFLLFSGHDKRTNEARVFVEINDGVVTKCWRG